MSAPINGGGPAFPTLFIEPNYGSGYAGMTMRDYFAAAAMQGILSNHQECSNFDSAKERAEYCYIVANAMLKAREAKP